MIVDTPEYRKGVRQREIEATAKQWVDQLGHFVNGMQSDQADAFATALSNEHPTLLAQIAKAVAIGVMRRATYDPTWRPFDGYDRACTEGGSKPVHAQHDGRLSCDTVIGAELMSRQFYI